MLLVTTPIGLIAGLYECIRLAGGLVFIMLAMVGVMLAALGTVIAAVRREARPATPEPKSTLPSEAPCKSS